MKQLTEMQIMHWDEMTNDDKLDRLTAVLTRAGADREFRKRCFQSVESAREAVNALYARWEELEAKQAR